MIETQTDRLTDANNLTHGLAFLDATIEAAINDGIATALRMDVGQSENLRDVIRVMVSAGADLDVLLTRMSSLETPKLRSITGKLT